MARLFANRRAILASREAQIVLPPLATMQATADYLLAWDQQEPSGAVSLADNIAVTVPDTRNVATLTYAAYVAGANWANSSAQIARHTAGSVETIQQNNIIAAGSTWEYPIVIANRTAGSVSVTGGDIPASINGTTVVAITAIGDDVIITPTTDFDGDIDLAQGTVRQTDILASSAYPGAELVTNPNMDWSAGALTGWTRASEDANRIISEVAANELFGGIGTGAVNYWSDSAGFAPEIRQTLTTVTGRRYKVTPDISTYGSGSLRIRINSDGSGDKILTSSGVDSYELEQTTPDKSLRQFLSNTTGDLTQNSISVTEANPLNGDDTGTTPGVAMGDYLSKTDDGVTSFTALGLTEYNSMIDSAQFHLGMSIQKATWDTTERDIISHIIDADNWIRIGGTTTAGQLVYEIRAGGVTEQILHASGSPTGIIMPSISSKGGTMKAWLGSTQIGGDVAIANTLTGNFATMTLGARNATPTNVNLANRAWYFHFSDEKTAAELAPIATSIGASQ